MPSASYEVFYHPDALKDVQKLDRPLLRRIRQTIEDRLATAPTDFGKPLRHTASGLWSLRVGDWRIIYTIQTTQVTIVRIGHRSEVYKLLP